MDELERFEYLSLVSAVQREMANHIGMDDKTLAEFLISLHDESADLKEFRAKLSESGSEFPESLISSIDRLVLTLHPKYKKKSTGTASGRSGTADAKAGQTILSEEAKRQQKMFPGLAMPDSQWQPSYESDATAGKIDVGGMANDVEDMMAQLEGVQKRHKGGDAQLGGVSAGSKRKRSISPPAVRRRSPDYNDSSRYGSRAAGTSRGEIDSAPVVYKVYDGRVVNIKDFGAFVQVNGISGKNEGTYHIC